jgi:hypothetical protein
MEMNSMVGATVTMRKLSVVGCLTLFILGGAFAIRGQKDSAETLSFMSGCWELNDNGRVTTERWAKPTQNLMLGTSQTVKDGRSVAFEFLRVVNNGHGLIYVAKPHSATAETAFAAIKTSENEAIFENLKHDFPQRIIYRRTSPDDLVARIEGTQNGKLNGMDIPMKRAKCE